MEDGVAKDPYRSDWIDALPEHVARIIVTTDRWARNVPQLQERFGAIDYEAGMHLDGDSNAMRGCDTRPLAPIGCDHLLPLPAQHVAVLWRPWASDPVGSFRIRRIARAA